MPVLDGLFLPLLREGGGGGGGREVLGRDP